MPGSMVGADIPRLRDMAKKFQNESQSLNSLIRVLDTETKNSQDIWRGGNADRFRGDWEGARGNFEKWVGTLSEASSALNKQADAIAAATGSG